MAITLVSTVTAAPGASGGATAAIDTTGATLIVVVLGSFGAGPAATVTDSKGNTYVGLTQQQNGWGRCRLFYCVAPTVGTGHTVTVGGGTTYPGVIVSAFAGVSAYASESGTATGATVASLACGTVTPAVNGALIVAGLSAGNSGGTWTDTIAPAGFSAVSTVPAAGGTTFHTSSAWQVQATAGAINPTWSLSPAQYEVAVVAAVFLPAASPASTRWRLYVTESHAGGNLSFATLEMASVAAGADLCTGGTASADSFFSGGYEAAKAFDANIATRWNNNATSVPNAWLEYQFPSAVQILQYRIRAGQDNAGAAGPKTWRLEYWDGSAWVTWDIQSAQPAWTTSELRTYTITVSATPVTRVSQDAVETLSLPLFPAARVTQDLVELLSLIGAASAVPSVVGLTLPAATTTLTAAGFTVGTVTAV